MKKIFISVFVLLILVLKVSCFVGSGNPIKLLGKCITDSDCAANEFCDHTGLNPIGKCQSKQETDKIL